jgi:CubicO group peptidase (beta-lactamase class C family)
MRSAEILPGLGGALLAAALMAVLAGCETYQTAAPISAHGAPVAAGDAIMTLDGRALAPAEIDETVVRLMGENRVPGLALALIRDGQAVYVQTYGYRDVENELPLLSDTVMYGASFTKAAFATMVMQLVDEGAVDLDRSISEMLPRPLPDYEEYSSLAGDARWPALTPRILLSHTSGFANLRWMEPDQQLRFHRDPGARYGYSGEGYRLLQFVLEQGLGLDVGAEMQRRVFDRFAMARTSMQWRDDFAGNVALGYALDGSMAAHDQRDNVSAAGSMDTTITDWSRFLAAAARGDGLSPESHAEMIRRQVVIDSVTQFPTLSEETTDANRAIGLGYGLGWGVFEAPDGPAFFKEGHDDWTANYSLCVAPERSCIAIMSNSVRAEGIFLRLADEIFGPTNLPWAWEGYVPFDLPEAKEELAP